jgi:EAL domain-containing protein (putative c-di-GMP-specific phosphodiesterase class I)
MLVRRSLSPARPEYRVHDLAISALGPADAWPSALQGVLGQPQRIRVEYQPIVDLREARICGYEALARFRDSPEVSPREWFDAAARLGCAGALEAQVMQAALVAHPLLVRGRFIAVNVSPAALLSEEVQTVLRAQGGRLRHLVVEISECDRETDGRALRAAADALRAAGAAIAVHGLSSHVTLDPRYVKVPRDEIADGQIPAQLDAAIVAERIETADELDVLVAMGVPYGQGFALGCPTPALTELRGDVRGRIQRFARPGHSLTIGALLEDAPAAPAAVTLDAPLRLAATTPLGEAARRAMARTAETRFTPIVVVDIDGADRGVLPIEHLVDALAR